MIALASEKPFAQGGNRLCFVHPKDSARCIKVRRPDFTLEDCRRKKGFPRNLRPLSACDDNLEEYNVVTGLVKSRGEGIHQHIYRCYGFVDTDLGKGLETELVRDADGLISLSLKQYIWEYGYHDGCRSAVERLISFWKTCQIPSRDLLTHNVLVQQSVSGEIDRLVVIDGLGSPHIIPFDWLPGSCRQRYVAKKTRRFYRRIAEFVENCQQGKQPSRIGMLLSRDPDSH